MPARLQRMRIKGWRKPEGSVIVDRSSLFGNPWMVLNGGSTRGWVITRARGGKYLGFIRGCYDNRNDATARVIEMYDRYLRITPTGRSLAIRAARELRGRDLLCTCHPFEPCHADVLLRVANE